VNDPHDAQHSEKSERSTEGETVGCKAYFTTHTWAVVSTDYNELCGLTTEALFSFFFSYA